jgi:hypothetical protein
MLKTIRCVLYGLAILTGVAGLFDSGTPLVKYMLQQWREHEYRGYYDTGYLNSPKIIFLLSLILLVCVRLSLALDKGIRPASPQNSIPSGKPTADTPALADEISQPPKAAISTMKTEQETADEKLTRLLNQKEK